MRVRRIVISTIISRNRIRLKRVRPKSGAMRGAEAKPVRHMNIWQVMLAVAMFAIVFSLWVTSESTRVMLIVMGIGVAVATITVVCLLRMFEMLGTMAYESTRRGWVLGLTRLGLLMLACALADGALIGLGVYLISKMTQL